MAYGNENTIMDGWCHLTIGTELVGKGPGSVHPEVTTMARYHKYGRIRRAVRRTTTKIEETAEITLHEFTQEAINILFGNALDTDASSLVTAGSSYRHEEVKMELFDPENEDVPFLTVVWPAAVISATSGLKAEAETESELPLKLEPEGVPAYSYNPRAS